MYKVLIRFLFVSLLMFSNTIVAKQVLRIGVGNFPPFFIEKDNQGIFIEITNEIFKKLPEYTVQYIFMSNSRLIREINSGEIIDAACNIFPDSNVKAHLSVPLFRYTDVAISKKSSKLSINKISDLQGKSIAAYQGAKELLGDEFKKMAVKNPKYTEHSHPKETTYLMLSDSKDIRIGDINIFWHDLNNKHYEKMAAKDFTIYFLWPDVFSHIAFKDPVLKDAVNKVIFELKSKGRIKEIYAFHKLKNLQKQPKSVN